MNIKHELLLECSYKTVPLLNLILKCTNELTNRRDFDDFSIGFHHDANDRREDARSYEDDNTKRKFHFSIFLKATIGFAELQQNTTYGPRYKLKMKKDNDSYAFPHLLAG